MFLMTKPQIERWLLRPIAPHVEKLQLLVGAIGWLMMVFSFVWLWPGRPMADPVTKWLVILWAILPRLWFLYEYQLYAIGLRYDRERLENIEKRQKYAEKIWLAIAAALVLLLIQDGPTP